MSSNTDAHPSLFTWLIHPPFVPGKTMEAKFCQNAFKIAKWHVKLRFVERRIGFWDILLFLIFNPWRGEREEIVTNGLVTQIHLDGNPIMKRSIPRYSFNARNRFRYFVETSTLMFAQTESHQMLVEIAISLSDIINEEIVQRPLHMYSEIPVQDDLRCLSRDLNQLALSSLYHNVDLHSSGPEVFRVHSYILSVRWPNLFQLHQFHTTANIVVKTNISQRLLAEILVYMYSGVLGGGWPYWQNPEYIAELFQVIYRYAIFHLYDALLKSDSSQIRVTKTSGLANFYQFRLHFIDDEPIIDASISIHPVEYITTHGVQNTQYEFKLEIQVRKCNEAGAWLSYSLQSTVNKWVYAQVNVEIIKMVVIKDEQREIVRRISAHAKNYNIGPNECKESGPGLFLGCIETFGDFPSRSPPEKTEQWFRFNISFTDGTSLHCCKSFDISRRSLISKYCVLRNHMREVWKQEIHADTRLESHSRQGNEVLAVHCVHKAILMTRIPRWYDVFVPCPSGHVLSKFATTFLSDMALPYVVDYIYTGGMVDVPQYLLEEILEFANRSRFYCLSNFINVLRYNRRAVL